MCSAETGRAQKLYCETRKGVQTAKDGFHLREVFLFELFQSQSAGWLWNQPVHYQAQYFMSELVIVS